MKALKYRIALITGSSRGIGAAIARKFAQEGAAVAIHGRDREALSSVKGEIERIGGRVIQVVGDVTRFIDIEAIRAQVEDQLGTVDLLVANAGGSLSMPGPLEDISERDWHATVTANLTATFLTIKGFLPAMKAQQSGTIITISSAAARRPHPGSPIPYAAAKAGIQMLTQGVAAQAGPYNVRVNCIAPETILTDRNLARIPQAQQSQLIDVHPLKRLGSPKDVADAALFLASDQSGWMTGVILDVAGGAVMTR
jgi:3-oxoacyl-[acyl-carrier protein] reductase